MPHRVAEELNWGAIRGTLRRTFGHADLRPCQKGPVGAALRGRDCFVLLPTGGGKSLCYQLPAVHSGRLAVVVTPLLSLMEDQVRQMRARGVVAEFLSSSLQTEEEQRLCFKRLFRNPGASGSRSADSRPASLLYVTPERLACSKLLLRALQHLESIRRLGWFVVDEAHCLSQWRGQWGHAFRPDYRGLHTLRRDFPRVPIIALTATAAQQTRQDVVAVLGMRDVQHFADSFNRPNLHYEVRPKTTRVHADVVAFVHARPGQSGIVYCTSRKECERLSDALQEATPAVRATFYHAGIEEPSDRRQRHEAWVKGEVQVVVATVAFGMGVHKPDVRFVLHVSLPPTPSHYYQESGRAGRDGQPADCVIFYSYADKSFQAMKIRQMSSRSGLRFMPPLVDGR